MTAGPEEIARAVARLRAGGLVAFPTETVYGLGADALDARAVARVFELKGRPALNPLIVHVADPAMARTVVGTWPARAETLARAFWPGPLTLVLPKADAVPDIVTGAGPTVGVRCPDHHITLSLLHALGKPLVGPSANPSGGLSPTTAEHVRASFSEEQVQVLDGGPCRAGIESTVLDLSSDPPRILRPGVVTAPQISRVLGCTIAGPGAIGSAGLPAPSPGLLGVHYAPRTPAVLLEPADWPAILSTAPRVAFLSHADRPVPPPHRLIRLPAEAGAYAARLYAALREADELGMDLLAIDRPPRGPENPELWDAILDRLTRATRPDAR